MSDVFCKIINGEIKVEFIDEGDEWFAIKDIHPVTPVHILIIPKRHGALQDYNDNDFGFLGKLIIAANSVAKKLGVDKTGYRLIINYGEDSQAHILDHMHIHLLAGKKLGSKLVKE